MIREPLGSVWNIQLSAVVFAGREARRMGGGWSTRAFTGHWSHDPAPLYGKIDKTSKEPYHARGARPARPQLGGRGRGDEKTVASASR